MKRLALTMLAAAVAMSASAQYAAPHRPQSIKVVPKPDNDLSVRVWTSAREYRVGDNVQINYRTNRDAYVLIFTTDANGETRQLLPNSYDSDNFSRGGNTHSIPNSGYRLEVTAPTGRETLTIVAFKERSRALEAYRSRKSEAFPKSDGARAAIARIVPRPNGNNDNRYAQDSTTIQVKPRRYYEDRWNGNRPGGNGDWNHNGHGNNDSDYGRLTVKSDPAGAYVYIDGQYRGITPLDLRRVSSGVYDIIINRAGFQPARKRVRVRSDKRTRIDEDLKVIRYR